MPDQVSFTEVNQSHAQTASSGSENRWQDIASGIMSGAGLAAKESSKYATTENIKEIGKACVEGAIFGASGEIGKAGVKVMKEAVQSAIRGVDDSTAKDKILNKADDAADTGKKTGKEKAVDGAASAIEMGAAIAGSAVFSKGTAEALKAGGRAAGQKALENKEKVAPKKDFDLKGEILSTPKDIADHFKKHPIRAAAEAIALPTLLIIDSKLSKD
ncbi:MAG TPA: hypothetical protein PKD05_21435 [Candidatus Melainabacteria bacterium]|nr:hypothetical protein [Candidatus Melainabacteria bacterium]